MRSDLEACLNNGRSRLLGVSFFFNFYCAQAWWPLGWRDNKSDLNWELLMLVSSSCINNLISSFGFGCDIKLRGCVCLSWAEAMKIEQKKCISICQECRASSDSEV